MGQNLSGKNRGESIVRRVVRYVTRMYDSSTSSLRSCLSSQASSFRGYSAAVDRAISESNVPDLTDFEPRGRAK